MRLPCGGVILVTGRQGPGQVPRGDTSQSIAIYSTAFYGLTMPIQLPTLGVATSMWGL